MMFLLLYPRSTFFDANPDIFDGRVFLLLSPFLLLMSIRCLIDDVPAAIPILLLLMSIPIF
jgi:hypothetical protein